MIFDPREMKVKISTKEDVRFWRVDLRLHLYATRSEKCDKCRAELRKTGFDVHEGVVSRQDVRGWKYPMKAYIFSEYNCVLLCPDCNRNNPPSRQVMWDLQCGRYGEGAMREWYEALPWRTGVPRRFWDAGGSISSRA